MASKALPSPEVLRQLLDYDPESGKLFWKERSSEWFNENSRRTAISSSRAWNRRYAGNEAFCEVATNGYLTGGIFKTKIVAHRVVWAMFYGEWPMQEVDHINGDKTDNSIRNLRSATRSQNCANRGSNHKRKGQFKCVYPRYGGRRWTCIVTDEGKTRNLGSFKTEVEAAQAYDAYATKKYGEHAKLNLPVVADMLAGEFNSPWSRA